MKSAESKWPFYLESNVEAAGAKKFPLYWRAGDEIDFGLGEGWECNTLYHISHA